jgi:CxxC motif-containing protein
MSRTTIICIGCPKGCRINVESENGKITDISGYSCPIGQEYARKEFENPTRILPTTVMVKKGEIPLAPVKTAAPIPKKLLLKAMKEIAHIEVEAPIYTGQIIKKDLLGTGVDLIATRSIQKL